MSLHFIWLNIGPRYLVAWGLMVAASHASKMACRLLPEHHPARPVLLDSIENRQPCIRRAIKPDRIS